MLANTSSSWPWGTPTYRYVREGGRWYRRERDYSAPVAVTYTQYGATVSAAHGRWYLDAALACVAHVVGQVKHDDIDRLIDAAIACALIASLSRLPHPTCAHCGVNLVDFRPWPLVGALGDCPRCRSSFLLPFGQPAKEIEKEIDADADDDTCHRCNGFGSHDEVVQHASGDLYRRTVICLECGVEEDDDEDSGEWPCMSACAEAA